MIIKDFSLEIVRELEIGLNKFLKKSIKYKVFALFYNLFKKANPNIMNDIRHYIAEDINHIVEKNKNFDINLISDKDYNLLQNGEKLLYLYRDLGYNILPKYLSIKKSFKLISNSDFRKNFYDFFLNIIEEILCEKEDDYDED